MEKKRFKSQVLKIQIFSWIVILFEELQTCQGTGITFTKTWGQSKSNDKNVKKFFFFLVLPAK